MNPPLLQVDQLGITFRNRNGCHVAVSNLSFHLHAGETLGIVGESGSGKSISCSALMGLLETPPAMINKESHVIFEQRDLLKLSEEEWRKIRGQKISIIFQDPMTSLNPYICIGDQVAEPLVLHQGKSWKEARQLAIEELERTGISDAALRAKSFPHEFSGGMRQRVLIAMALITRPKILIADEPTTALDVTVQKQVLDLLVERQKELGTAILLITHDLGLVKNYAHRVQVMYAGSIVETGTTHEILTRPRHAYTRALIASIPSRVAKGAALQSIPGMPPKLNDEPHECSFRPRNTMGDASLCLRDRRPELIEISEGHWVQNCPGCLANSNV